MTVMSPPTQNTTGFPLRSQLAFDVRDVVVQHLKTLPDEHNQICKCDFKSFFSLLLSTDVLSKLVFDLNVPGSFIRQH